MTEEEEGMLGRAPRAGAEGAAPDAEAAPDAVAAALLPRALRLAVDAGRGEGDEENVEERAGAGQQEDQDQQEGEDGASHWIAQLGPVAPLWNLVMEGLTVYSDPCEDDAVARCVERAQTVGAQGAKPGDGGGEHEEPLAPRPSQPGEAMRALAALIFDTELLFTLISTLGDMDALMEEAEDDAEDGADGENTSTGDRVGRNSFSVLVCCLDSLQGCPDPAVRKWAIKGLWRLLHALEQHGDVCELLPGLEGFETGATRLESLTVKALLCAPGTDDASADRPPQARPFVLRKAFAQSLLSRMISLEQRGRKAGSRTSFVLGSGTSHGSSSSGAARSSNSLVGSLTRERGALFETGKRTGSDVESEKAETAPVSAALQRSSNAAAAFTIGRSSRLGATPGALPSPRGGAHPAGGIGALPRVDTGLPPVATELSPRNRGNRRGSGLDRRLDEISASEQRISGLRDPASGGGGSRASGLRSSRLAQLIMQARRSSMSMIGSVHTYASDDLSFGRESSALGLDSNFLFPRLTGISIPEGDVFNGEDKRIWSSKALSGTGSAAQESGASPDFGIVYTDCATLCELILGHVVGPADPNHFQTVDAFLQPLGAPALELVPVLLCMLTWISDNSVRREFVASLYTLALSSERNLHMLSATESWRTTLLRLLQTIPRDKEFRDEAAEFMVHRITELVCVGMLPSAPLFAQRSGVPAAVPPQIRLGDVAYEAAVLGGWNDATVDLVRMVLGKCLSILQQRPAFGVEIVRQAVQAVETYALFAPCREEALLGYAGKGPMLVRALAKQSFDSEVAGGEDVFSAGEAGEGGAAASEAFDNSYEASESSESSEGDDSQWLWAPLLGQSSPMEMAENQVDFLELQEILLRRGVDFGMHLDGAKTAFADASLVAVCMQLAFSTLQRVEQGLAPNDEAATCLAAGLHRLQQVAAHMDQAEAQVRTLVPGLGEVDEQAAARILTQSQLSLMQTRAAQPTSCTCTYCSNMRRADAHVLAAAAASAVAAAGADRAAVAEHFALAEAGSSPPMLELVQLRQAAEAPRRALPLERMCPICKEDPTIERRPSKDYEDDGLLSQLDRLQLTGTPPPPPQQQQQRGADVAPLRPSPLGLPGGQQGRPPSAPEPGDAAPARNGKPVPWSGFLWHRKHLRCYTCAKVLNVRDKEDPPVFDAVAGWPFCQECAQQKLATCPGCAETIEGCDEDELLRVGEHRVWHKEHACCARCGETRGVAPAPRSQLLLCPAHLEQDELPTCVACGFQITSEAVRVCQGAYLHASGPCLVCSGCLAPLTPSTARWNGMDKRRVQCVSCVETAVRPSCAVCTRVVLFSEDRLVVVPTRPDRIDNVAFEVVEGVITGKDGRLRCHEGCLACAECGDPLAGDDETCFYLLPSADKASFKAFCRKHLDAALCEGAGNGEGASGEERVDAEDARTENAASDVQQVSAGHFLYIDASGAQAGPVNGAQLCELALSGELQADTNVWTPGMAQWMPLAELGQLGGQGAAQS